MIVDAGEEGAFRRAVEMFVPALVSNFHKSQPTEAYSGLSTFSHPSKAKSQYVHVAISSLSGVGVYFQPASTICIISSIQPFLQDETIPA